ncbi:hypothetical protein LTR96_011542 [Exophiala xenobiotica]|nr:hypothetical protein LTR96_011542 [Exophiala xenobiotica]KAK5332356.1 hypothetical protein LTR98_011512 [Exophiala xenobiotica]
MWASEYGHEKVVQLLLEWGADVNTQGGDYGNALHAASLGGHEKVEQMSMLNEDFIAMRSMQHQRGWSREGGGDAARQNVAIVIKQFTGVSLALFGRPCYTLQRDAAGTRRSFWYIHKIYLIISTNIVIVIVHPMLLRIVNALALVVVILYRGQKASLSSGATHLCVLLFLYSHRTAVYSGLYIAGVVHLSKERDTALQNLSLQNNQMKPLKDGNREIRQTLKAIGLTAALFKKRFDAKGHESEFAGEILRLVQGYTEDTQTYGTESLEAKLDACFLHRPLPSQPMTSVTDSSCEVCTY